MKKYTSWMLVFTVIVAVSATLAAMFINTGSLTAEQKQDLETLADARELKAATDNAVSKFLVSNYSGSVASVIDAKKANETWVFLFRDKQGNTRTVINLDGVSLEVQ